MSETVDLDGHVGSINGSITPSEVSLDGFVGSAEGSATFGGSFGLRLDGHTGEIHGEIQFPYWRIENRDAIELIEETRDWQTLSATFRVNKETLSEVLRPLDDSVGKFEIVEKPDGSYMVVERGASAITAVAPSMRSDLRTSTEWVVEEYDEISQDQESDIYEVEIVLVATEPKTGGHVHDGPDWDETDEWLFEFADGSVATDRINREVGRGGETIEGAIQLDVILERTEAIVMEESLNRQAGVRTRDVPDGIDKAEDNSDGERNVVEITAPTERDPDEDVIDSGRYVVEAWETDLINDEFFAVGLNLVKYED